MGALIGLESERTRCRLMGRATPRVRKMASLFVCSLFFLQTPTMASARPLDDNDTHRQPTNSNNNNTCADPRVTWYHNVDGLNPCEQYERLRRICQPTFTTPLMPRRIVDPASLPGTCDSQSSDCCCNSIAFNLAVTCAACQWGLDTAAIERPKEDTGIYDVDHDVPSGTYQAYLGSCLPLSVNRSLPEITQRAVCASRLDLPAFLYNLFWSDGSVSLRSMFDWASLHDTTTDVASSDRCFDGSQTAQQAAVFISKRDGDQADTNMIIAIVGGVLGALGLLSTLAVLLWIKCRADKRPSSAERYPTPSTKEQGIRSWRAYRNVKDPLADGSSSVNFDRSTEASVTPYLLTTSSITPYVLAPATTTTTSSSSNSSNTDTRTRSSTSNPAGSSSLVDNDRRRRARSNGQQQQRRRRDEKLQACEMRPDGKDPLPFILEESESTTTASESSGSGGSGGSRTRRQEKMAQLDLELTPLGTTSSSKGKEVRTSRVRSGVETTMQLRGARPPSYATDAIF